MSSSSSAPPTSASAGPSSASSSPSSSAPSAPPSSAPPSSASSAPPSTSASVSPSSTPSAPSSPSVSLIRSTDASGIVVTVTSTKPFTPVGPTNPSQTGGAAATGNKGFFENKAAVGATFGIVGVVALGIIFMLVTGALRRRRARAFDREAEEEAKRAPPPVFMDDDEDGYGGAGGYSAYGAAAGGHNADHYGQEQYAAADYPLGFSDVSSHGTYAQQPMEAQYGGGGGGYGAAAAYGGAAAAAGAYEMTGYGHGGHQGGYGAAQQHDWAAVQPQTGYVYPGEEQGYPPAPAPSNDSATLARSKSYGTGSPAPSAAAATQIPSYADGYAAQYQTPHIVEGEDEGYGGMHRSEHGHVEYPYDDEDDGKPKILKVANE